MKINVYEISYYIQDRGEEMDGPSRVQTPVRVGGEDDAAAVAILKHQVEDELGVRLSITHISNVTQDVLIADPVPSDSSEADSLKAALSAQIEENTALIESHNEVSTQLAALKAENSVLTSKVAAIEGDLAKANEQLNQKPQPAPAPPAVEPPPAPAQPT